ncbi:hypothetical protein E4T39_00315 [Aureobasidium subglaciale]|nr:hypothetical protein E4T39_00315 [Aureobasidium subglaciale]
MILTVIAISKLKITSISIWAREKNWDDDRDSPSEPHEAYPQVDFGVLTARLYKILNPIAGTPTSKCLAPNLAVFYPSGGSVTYGHVEQCLKIWNIDTCSWHELRDWLELVECIDIDIQDCGINLNALRDLLSSTRKDGYPSSWIQRFSSEVLLLMKARPRSLIGVISSYAPELEYIRLADIRCSDTDVQWPASSYGGQQGLVFKKKNEMRQFLSALYDRY